MELFLIPKRNTTFPDKIGNLSLSVLFEKKGKDPQRQALEVFSHIGKGFTGNEEDYEVFMQEKGTTDGNG